WPPHRGDSNEFPQHIVFWAEMRGMSDFLSENFTVFGSKISISFVWACFRGVMINVVYHMTDFGGIKSSDKFHNSLEN
ncbi:MAG: hypothetical protein N0E48_22420, partial [Candidatus Thiodiazotropha endolucinida]|nr:hypothetical protein [Candidatus Thiodiazotropha taylori]MCW4346090.1 hypothetical protein [Candidatus Thiodiazotropha endolucinida]